MNRTNSVVSILSQEREIRLSSIDQLSRKNSQADFDVPTVPARDSSIVSNYIREVFNERKA